MNRRKFTQGMTMVPLGFALSRSARAQQSQNAQAAAPPRKTEAEYNRHQPIHEPDPFAETIVFERHEFQSRLAPFELNEVQLAAGPLFEARQWNRGYIMRLPNDRLLHNFRVTAGMPSAAKPLGGWEAPHAELRGHFVGHYLSACALLYASTTDAAIKRKADDLVAGIAACQVALNDNGYVSGFPDELFERLDRRAKVWAPFYTLHKIMAGLLDMYVLTGNRQALEVDLKLAEWVDAWTASKPEAHMQDILNTEYGGMGEVLYNLAAVTRNDRWAVTGDRFVKKIFYTPLAQQQDKLKGLHANTHMPQVISAARRFELSSDPRFGEVSEFFWQTVASSRSYATGGSANTESWLTNANHIALEVKASSHHQECCCAYNMMKLSRHLYSWSADPRYIDYYERNLLNHRLGTIQPRTGHTTYFLSMSAAAWKTLCTEDETFWCCTGTALEEFSKLNDTIYFHDAEGVYLNLFVASALHWKEKGVRLRQETRFPETDNSVVTIEAAPTEAWALHLRIPSWTTTENVVRINGRKLEVTGTPGSYFTLRRTWKAGDTIELTLPMKLRAEMLPDDPTQQAFLYGPVVLAGQFPLGEIDDALMHNQGPQIEELPPFEVPALSAKSEEPAAWIAPVAGQPLIFQTMGQTRDVVLKPISQSWERFAVYFKVT